MATYANLAFMDATAQAELVRKKEIKATELVEAAIERIERLNPTLNAVVTPMYDLARDAVSKEIPQGPFTGTGTIYGGALSDEGYRGRLRWSEDESRSCSYARFCAGSRQRTHREV
jgi:hypothetical protein